MHSRNGLKILTWETMYLRHVKCLASRGKYKHNTGLSIHISHVELWDIKFIATLVWTATNLSAKTPSLMDIFEPHQLLVVA